MTANKQINANAINEDKIGHNKFLNVFAIFDAIKGDHVVILKDGEREVVRFHALATQADIGNDLKAFPDATAWIVTEDRETPLSRFLSRADFLAGRKRPPLESESKAEPVPKAKAAKIEPAPKAKPAAQSVAHNLTELLTRATNKGLSLRAKAQDDIKSLNEAHEAYWNRYGKEVGGPVATIDQFQTTVRELLDAVSTRPCTRLAPRRRPKGQWSAVHAARMMALQA